jgi:enterochelin esterase-like enzyme
MVKKTTAVFVLILISAFMTSYSGYGSAASSGSVPAINEKIAAASTPQAVVSAKETVSSSSTPQISITPSETESVSNTPQTSLIPIETVSVSIMPQQTSQIQIHRIIVRSPFLNKDINVNVYLPPNYDITEEYPVLYFLHGYRGDENDWEKEMDLVDSAYDLFSSGKIEPFIIVTPDIENSYCINSQLISGYITAGQYAGFNNGYYEDYIIDELIPYIDSNYSTVASREGRYIGGLSMGGYAALHLCFAHTDLFSKAGGHSPALWIYTTNPVKFADVLSFLYPSVNLREERDPLVQVNSADLSGIKIWLDCGTRDFYGFNVGTKKLYEVLISKEAQVEYHAFSGGHNKDYWKTHLKEYLTFYGS